MPEYIVTYGPVDTERINAARVVHDPDGLVYNFYDEDGTEVAWVSTHDARSVVLASLLNQARPTQVIR